MTIWHGGGWLRAGPRINPGFTLSCHRIVRTPHCKGTAPVTEPIKQSKRDLPAMRPLRTVDRVPFTAIVQFRKGQTRVTVRILDISTHGARLSAVHHLRGGETFWLKLPLLEPQEAVAVWSNEFIVGCKFVKPLQPYVLDNILRSLGGAAR